MYIERLITKRLKKLVQTFPVLVMVGARQVGKSTLLNHVYGESANCVVFDPIMDIENARQDPELFLDNHKTPLILDEVQYAPELISVIKRRIDKNRSPGQYLMTGSQQWGVIKSMAESLAGRAVFIDLESFSLLEITQKKQKNLWLEQFIINSNEFIASKPSRISTPFALYEQLWRGFFPEAQTIPLDIIPDYYTSYTRTYIERDVRIIADVSDLQLFHRFFQLTAALSAQEINYSQLGREFGINPQTAKTWLEILKETFQWIEIPAFSGNVIKRLSNKPKGYLTDTGLICNSQAISSPQALGGHPLWGSLFETGVVSEIRKHCTCMTTPPKLYHWRSHGGAEVDLILEKDGYYFPIEIKASSRPNKYDARGILEFKKTYPQLNIQTGLIIAPSENIYPVSGNIFVVPWDIGG